MALEQVQIDLIINTAASAKTLGEVRDATKQVKAALDQVGIGSDNFKKLNAQLEDGSEKILKFRRGVDGLKAFEAFGKTITSSFGIASAAIGVFADDNEKLQKSLLKVQSALTLVTSFTQLGEAIKAAKVANEALNLSFLSNPYVLVAVGVAAAAAAIYSFTQNEESAEDKTKRLNKELDNQTAAFDQLTAATKRKTEEDKAATRDQEDQLKIQLNGVDDLIKKNKEYISSIEDRKTQLGQDIVFNGSVIKAIEEVNKKTDLSIEQQKELKKRKEDLADLESQRKILLSQLGFAEEDAGKKALEAAEKQKKLIKDNGEAIAKQVKDNQDNIQKRIDADIEASKAASKRAEEQKKDDQEAEERVKKLDNANRQLTQTEKDQIAIQEAAATATVNYQNAQIAQAEALKKAIEDVNKAQEIASFVNQQLTSAISSIDQALQTASDNRIASLEYERERSTEILTQQKDEELSILQDKLNAGVLSKDQFTKQTAILDEKFGKQQEKANREANEKLKEERIKAFNQTKAIQIAQAVITTAQAVLTAYSDGLEAGGPAGPAVGAAYAAIAGAIGALQIGLITAQQAPSFATGGLFRGKGGPTEDANQIRISNGEFIMNAASTNAFLPMLEMMNRVGNGSINTGQRSNVEITQQNAVPQQFSVNRPSNINVSISQNDIREAGILDNYIKAKTTF